MATSPFLSEEDLHRFRTKPCRREKQKGCEFGPNRCQYSHNDYWPRRCPFYLTDRTALRYLPYTCPLIKLGEKDVIVENKCDRGGHCPFSHSWEEVLYHPLFYKTNLCNVFHEGECESYYCPYVHGLAEQRAVHRVYTLPYTRGIALPKHPNVSVRTKGKEAVSLPCDRDGRLSNETELPSNNSTKGPLSKPLRGDTLGRNHLAEKLTQGASWDHHKMTANDISLSNLTRNIMPQTRTSDKMTEYERAFVGGSSLAGIKLDAEYDAQLPVELFVSHSSTSTRSPPLSVSSTRSTSQSNPIVSHSAHESRFVGETKTHGNIPLLCSPASNDTFPHFPCGPIPSASNVPMAEFLGDPVSRHMEWKEGTSATTVSTQWACQCKGTPLESTEVCSPALLRRKDRTSEEDNHLTCPIKEIKSMLTKALDICEGLDVENTDVTFGLRDFEELTDVCYVTLGALMAKKSEVACNPYLRDFVKGERTNGRQCLEELSPPMDSLTPNSSLVAPGAEDLSWKISSETVDRRCRDQQLPKCNIIGDCWRN